MSRYEIIAQLEDELISVAAQLVKAEREYFAAPFDSPEKQEAEDRV